MNLLFKAKGFEEMAGTTQQTKKEKATKKTQEKQTEDKQQAAQEKEDSGKPASNPQTPTILPTTYSNQITYIEQCESL